MYTYILYIYTYQSANKTERQFVSASSIYLLSYRNQIIAHNHNMNLENEANYQMNYLFSNFV